MTPIVRRALLPAAMILAAAAFPAAAQETAAPAQPAPAAEAAPAPAPAPAAAPAEAATTAAPAEAAAPAAPAEVTVGTPAAGKGQVVFFRPGGRPGFLLTFSVHEGDKGVVKLPSGSFYAIDAEPGAHTYTIQSEAKDSLTLEVEAGEVYYVEQTMGMGLMVGRPHLNPSDQATFAKTKLKPSGKKATDLKS
jgi:hypothetical protein